jgi:hypothetical protein
VELDNTVRIFRIALSYDGTTVAVALESFRAEGFVELLDATTGKELLRLKHHTQVVSVAFSGWKALGLRRHRQHGSGLEAPAASPLSLTAELLAR